MKIQKIYGCFSLLLFITVVVGCSQLTESKVTPSPAASVLTVSSAFPTDTMLPTLTSAATDIPTQLSTPTIVPTLSIEDARKRLLELLATNGDCRLPCLWGITPGKSNYLEARNILFPLSNVVATYFAPSTVNGISMGSASPLYIEDDLQLNTRVAYWYGDNGIVDYVAFRVVEQQLSKDQYGNQLTTPIFDSPTFAKRTEYYSISHVLTEQGVPDSVTISFYLPSDNPAFAGGFEIALFYPEQGIWVHYTMPLYSPSGIQRGCPTNAHVEMALFSPGDPDYFFSYLEKTDWGRTKGGYKPLEEVTSMSVEEFYQTFRNPTDKCIETPENLWLTPEP